MEALLIKMADEYSEKEECSLHMKELTEKKKRVCANDFTLTSIFRMNTKLGLKQPRSYLKKLISHWSPNNVIINSLMLGTVTRLN